MTALGESHPSTDLRPTISQFNSPRVSCRSRITSRCIHRGARNGSRGAALREVTCFIAQLVEGTPFPRRISRKIACLGELFWRDKCPNLYE